MNKHFIQTLIFLLTGFFCTSLTNTVFAVENISAANENEEKLSLETKVEKWLIVLKDPRSERRKQWTGGAGYQIPPSYEQSLLLQRLAKHLSEDYGLTLVEQWPIKALSVHCLVINVAPHEKIILTKLQQDKRVKWIQSFQTFEGLDNPDSATTNNKSELDIVDSDSSKKGVKTPQEKDPYRQLQSIFEKININRLKPSLDGSGVTIAMIDSGVEIAHSDLFYADTHYKNFVSENNQQRTAVKKPDQPAEHHGTGIASVMIAQTDNGKGIAGIAPAATLYAYRGCWELENGNTRCNTLSLSRALDSVVELSPDILNLSLTGPKDPLLEELLAIVIANGTSVVVAFDENRSSGERFPSQREGVIFARNEPPEPGSIFDYVSIPGNNVLAAQPIDTYGYMSGNSLSSAHLTAVLALIKQARPNLTPTEISQMFFRRNDQYANYNQINVCQLLQMLEVENPCF